MSISLDNEHSFDVESRHVLSFGELKPVLHELPKFSYFSNVCHRFMKFYLLLFFFGGGDALLSVGSCLAWMLHKEMQSRFRMFNVVHLAFLELKQFSHKENITVRGIND